MNRHLAFPEICERCDRKIDGQTGWGVMMICAVQPQPSVTKDAADNREQSLLMCGYCLHELAGWLCSHKVEPR
jgi:hypothetical protein